jgi:hypothetical protein
MYLATTVHTSGVNWESVIAIVGGVVTIMTVIFGLFARYVSNSITGSIDRFRIEVIQKLDRRITVLETLAKLYYPKSLHIMEDDTNDTLYVRCYSIQC